MFGVTYVTLAPEHPLVLQVATNKQRDKVQDYIELTQHRSDLDRTLSKEKTGIFTGGYVIHPFNETIHIPIWIADYVLGSYGTGAVMAVPAHDIRDYEFAKTYQLPMKHVVIPSCSTTTTTTKATTTKATEEEITAKDDMTVFTDDGVLINSGPYNGLTTEEAKLAITEKLTKLNKGGTEITYKLRDWVFSRQRYWGEPIPIYFPVTFPDGVDPMTQDPRLDNCVHTIQYDQPIPMKEEDLPLTLPYMEDFQPGDDPAGCLARAKDWRYFQQQLDNDDDDNDDNDHPKQQWFARETNTMPQWAGSCWYYFRFTDPKNDQQAFSQEADSSWMPVDLYVGGAEHAVLHLLYARFWHQVLYDLGITIHQEPFQKLVHQGMILGSDGEKMSKSRGNVVNPDDIVDEQGADALRLYEMFMGPLEAVKPWQTSQVAGVVRFMQRVYTVVVTTMANPKNAEMDDETLRIMQKTMKKVTNDIETMSFNTAISALMVYTNHLQSLKDKVPMEAVQNLALMVSPFAPHLGEECWNLLGHDHTLAYEPWVQYDEALCVDDTVSIGVQVNGKARGEVSIPTDADQNTALTAAQEVERIQKFVHGKEIKKVIYVPGRILNIIVK